MIISAVSWNERYPSHTMKFFSLHGPPVSTERNFLVASDFLGSRELFLAPLPQGFSLPFRFAHSLSPSTTRGYTLYPSTQLYIFLRRLSSRPSVARGDFASISISFVLVGFASVLMFILTSD